jgi:hypothetical protein
MLKREVFRIAKIYVPAKRRRGVNVDLVREIAESILQIGQQTPILVPPDADRFILVEGVHRLEACKALGETTIIGFSAQANFRTEEPGSSYDARMEAIRQKIDHLKELRLAKEAAATSTSERTAEGPTTTGEATTSIARNGGRARRSTKISLLQWLGQREAEGFRN